jgi:pyrimidine-nucleoside phosphorylase
VDLSIDEFKQVLREVGTSIIGQTATLVPADKRLYALRDVTATVESVPLIAASVMSKKIAEGSSALVLDVKCGDGAFMRDLDGARALATAMVAIGAHAGVRTEAFITDMDAPLGRAIGNALEIVECLDTLKGRGPADLADVVIRLAARMVVLAGVEREAEAARRRAAGALASGAALQVFTRMIERQGGDPRVADDDRLLASAPDRAIVTADRGGVLVQLRAGAVGRASHVLGAGRSTVGAPVDHAVGIRVLADRGTRVEAGQPLLELHHRDGRGLEAALALCATAIGIDEGAAPYEARERVLGEVR